MKPLKQKSLADFFQKDSFCLLLLFGFVFLLISPIIYWGIPDGFDLPQHYQFAITYYEAIKSGDFFLSWSAQTNYGFGDIGLRFYPPLAHYLLAFTQIFTNDWQTTSWINILFWMLVGSIGIYFFARHWLSPRNALLVGMFYAFAPYHLSQIYQYFLYSEFAAAGILPFCFLFVTKINCEGKVQNVLLLGFFSGLLILTHIPTTIIGIICLSLYSIIILDWKNKEKVIPRFIFSGLIALLLTSFYWIKLITEMNWVNHIDQKFSAAGYYNYKSAFFPFFSTVNELYFVKQMWFRDIVGILTYLLLVPIFIYLITSIIKPKTPKKEYLSFFAVAFLAAFMSTNLSSFIWDNLSFLQKLQFPYRWLSVTSLMGVLSFVLVFQNTISTSRSIRQFKEYTLISFFLILSLFNITQIILPSGLLSKNQFEEKISGLKEDESFDCWWTVWAKKEAFQQKEKVIAQNRDIRISTWEGEKREFEIGGGQMTNARIATFYYPHWKATINDENVEVSRNEDGTISIALPTESAKVRLSFIEPFRIRVAEAISAICWVLLIFAGLIYFFRNNRNGLKFKLIN